MIDLPTPYRPATKADAPALARFARIGLMAGKDFDPSILGKHAFAEVPKLSFDRMKLHFLDSDDMKRVNGWNYTVKAGIYFEKSARNVSVYSVYNTAGTYYLGSDLGNPVPAGTSNSLPTPPRVRPLPRLRASWRCRGCTLCSTSRLMEMTVCRSSVV